MVPSPVNPSKAAKTDVAAMVNLFNRLLTQLSLPSNLPLPAVVSPHEDRFNEFFEQNEQLKIKAQQLIEILTETLAKENEEEVVQGVVACETEMWNIERVDKKWDVEEIRLLVEKIINKVTILQGYNVISEGNHSLKKFRAFVEASSDQILNKNYFLNYVLEIQSKLSLSDILRIIRDAVLHTNVFNGFFNDERANILVGYDAKSAIMEKFLSENAPELSDKFSGFSVETDKPSAYVCDFLLILRIFLQDQHSISLYLKEDFPDGPHIFRSLKSSKAIQDIAYEFFYEYLGIDPEIQGNSPDDLRINLYLFKKLLIYMLRSSRIVLKSTEEETNSPSPDKISDLGLQDSPSVSVKKFSENDFSVEYKLMLFMQEIRVSMENTLIDNEKHVCNRIVQSIAKEIKSLGGFEKHFDGKSAHFEIMKEFKTKVLEMFAFYRSDRWSHSTLSGSDSDKYSLFMDRLSINNIAPEITRKHYSVLCKEQLNNHGNIMDIHTFTLILERICDKATSMTNGRLTFKQTLQYILDQSSKLQAIEQPRVLFSPTVASRTIVYPTSISHNFSRQLLVPPVLNHSYAPIRRQGRERQSSDRRNSEEGVSAQNSLQRDRDVDRRRGIVIGRRIQPSHQRTDG